MLWQSTIFYYDTQVDTSSTRVKQGRKASQAADALRYFPLHFAQAAHLVVHLQLLLGDDSKAMHLYQLTYLLSLACS